MKEDKKLRQCIHYNMSLCGGFFGGYAILNRFEVFGNALTANLMHLAIGIVGRNAEEVVVRLVAMLIYVVATMCTVIIPRYTKWSLYALSVIVDAGAVLILGMLPQAMNPVVALYPVFFAMAFQWNVFADLCGYVSSSIFSTNNARQMSISFTRYLLDRKKEDLERGKFYAGVLLFFNTGVAIAYIAWKSLGLKAIYICFIPLITAMILVGYGEGWIVDKNRITPKKVNAESSDIK